MTARNFFIICLSLAVSAATLLFILRDVPLHDVAASLQATDPFYLLLAFLSTALSLFLRGGRWWELLSRRLSLLRATHMVNVMFLGNQLPLRLGEVARSMLAKRDGLPLVTAATSIVVERLIDTLLVVLLIAAVISQLSAAPPAVSESAAAFGLVALIGFLGLLALARVPQFAAGLLEKLLALLPPLRRLPLPAMLSNTLAGLQPLTQWRTLTFTALWTGGAWIVSAFAYYFLHRALGIEVNIMLSVPLSMALAALSSVLPLSIAGLGPFEAAIVLSGQLVGMDSLDAIALAFLLHGLSVFSFALWGGIGLLALGISPASTFARKNSELT